MNILNIFKTKKKSTPRVRNSNGMYARKVIIKTNGVASHYFYMPSKKGIKYV